MTHTEDKDILPCKLIFIGFIYNNNGNYKLKVKHRGGKKS